jgi:aspartyl-tRNA(Asn)/glutamyl-tRNA(Gln) amidotransferase subunit A
VQFIGRPLAEPLVLRLAHVFEQACAWPPAIAPGLD